MTTEREAKLIPERRWNELVAAVHAAGEYPTDEELQRIRIATKRCRFAVEAVAPVVGRPASPFVAGVEVMQTVLGDCHDTVVAELWLRNVAVELVDCRHAMGGLIAIARHERERVREAWPATWHQASSGGVRAWL